MAGSRNSRWNNASPITIKKFKERCEEFGIPVELDLSTRHGFLWEKVPFLKVEKRFDIGCDDEVRVPSTSIARFKGTIGNAYGIDLIILKA